MGSRKKHGEDTQGQIPLSASGATATATRRSATTTRPWTRSAWAWTSMATSSAAGSATTVTPTRLESTAKRASMVTTDQSGCSPTTRRPVSPAIARTTDTRVTARQRMGSVSAKRHTGGLMTVRLVLRFFSKQLDFYHLKNMLPHF